MKQEELKKDEEEFRDSITTINSDGSRNWIYAKKPGGFWYKNDKLLRTLFLLYFL